MISHEDSLTDLRYQILSDGHSEKYNLKNHLHHPCIDLTMATAGHNIHNHYFVSNNSGSKIPVPVTRGPNSGSGLSSPLPPNHQTHNHHHEQQIPSFIPASPSSICSSPNHLAASNNNNGVNHSIHRNRSPKHKDRPNHQQTFTSISPSPSTTAVIPVVASTTTSKQSTYSPLNVTTVFVEREKRNTFPKASLSPSSSSATTTTTTTTASSSSSSSVAVTSNNINNNITHKNNVHNSRYNNSSSNHNSTSATISNGPPRFEAYMMTGDIIINLANTKSNDNLLLSNSGSNGLNERFRKRQRTIGGNIHSKGFSSEKDSLPHNGTSLPSSPAGKGNENDDDHFDNHIDDEKSSRCSQPDQVTFRKKSSNENYGSHRSSSNGRYDDEHYELTNGTQYYQQHSQHQQQPNLTVRLSKSEDQLIRSSLTLSRYSDDLGHGDIDDIDVEGDICETKNNQSTSLDMLLNQGNNETQSKKLVEEAAKRRHDNILPSNSINIKNNNKNRANLTVASSSSSPSNRGESNPLSSSDLIKVSGYSPKETFYNNYLYQVNKTSTSTSTATTSPDDEDATSNGVTLLSSSNGSSSIATMASSLSSSPAITSDPNHNNFAQSKGSFTPESSPSKLPSSMGGGGGGGGDATIATTAAALASGTTTTTSSSSTHRYTSTSANNTFTSGIMDQTESSMSEGYSFFVDNISTGSDTVNLVSRDCANGSSGSSPTPSCLIVDSIGSNNNNNNNDDNINKDSQSKYVRSQKGSRAQSSTGNHHHHHHHPHHHNYMVSLSWSSSHDSSEIAYDLKSDSANETSTTHQPDNSESIVTTVNDQIISTPNVVSSEITASSLSNCDHPLNDEIRNSNNSESPCTPNVNSFRYPSFISPDVKNSDKNSINSDMGRSNLFEQFEYQQRQKYQQPQTNQKLCTHNGDNVSDQQKTSKDTQQQESSVQNDQQQETQSNSNITSSMMITSSSSSTSENESSSEDEMELPENCHYSPPKNVDREAASRLAKRLYNLEGFKRSDVCRHLSKNNDFSRIVAEEYLKYFDFKGDTLDGALRKFLTSFCLIGETQERERVLQHFSKRYLDCNPASLKSTDSLHTLTCAIMLLNTDLHGENVGRKMTCNEFVDNLSDLNDGEDFPKDVLVSIYQSIKSEPLQWAFDEDGLTMVNGVNSRLGLFGSGSLSSSSASSTLGHLNSSGILGNNPFLKLPNPNTATEYKRGYIMRKCCFDMNGKKTPFGKRGWKMFYATLRDLVLFLHKDEQGFRKNQLYESLHNSIRIHHALATPATDYTKKQHVFRLQTADQSEYLFQTSDAQELQSWVDTINLVAGTLSAPPLPSAVGSQSKKFQKPLLPSSHTKFNTKEQLADHEMRIQRIAQELEDHVSKHPDKGANRRVLNEFAEKQSYLEYELKRYSTYASILRTKLQQVLGSGGLLEGPSKVMTSLSSKSKPLTQLSIGEEQDIDEEKWAEEGHEYQEKVTVKPRSHRVSHRKGIR